MDSDPDSVFTRAKRIRSISTRPRLAKSPARHSHARLPGHSSLPVRKARLLCVSRFSRFTMNEALPTPRFLGGAAEGTVGRTHTASIVSLGMPESVSVSQGKAVETDELPCKDSQAIFT